MSEIKSSSPVDYSNSPPANNPQPEQVSPLSPQDPQEEQDPSQEESSAESKSNTIKSIISTVILFLAAPLLALFLIVFVIQSYEVDGPSMQQTLHNKDLLIVSKIDRTLARITRRDYIPPRYQIIIFTLDESGGVSGGESRQLVKRVIGLPGERVVVKDGTVTVFNKEHPDGFNPDKDKEYSKSFSTTNGNVDVTVQPGQVFVMGDNRGNSLDSRYFGPIDDSTIVGKLGMRIFPLNKARTF
ncbi:MAG: signal peptidase I [Candidatus Saccharimonadales bacterium]